MDSDERYARHRLIAGWDQKTLATSTAVVVGVGALGNEVAKNLALAGFGRLILCDPDTVSASNLSRTVLLAGSDVGRPKVNAATAALRRLAPDLAVETRATDLVRGVGLGELAGAAVILGCLDSRRARLALLGRAALVDALLVDGGTQPWGGEIRIRADPADSCYGCSLTPHERSESDVPWSCAEAGPVHAAAASIASTAIVAGWMTLVALRLLFARASGPADDGPADNSPADGGLADGGPGSPPENAPPYRLLRIDGLTGRTGPVVVRRDPGCPHHQPLDGPVTMLSLDEWATVGELLAALPAGADPRCWAPVALPGRCPRCDTRYEPTPIDDAGLLSCPGCGQPSRIRRTDSLRGVDPARPLRDLGVPRGEILPVRTPDGAFHWYQLRI